MIKTINNIQVHFNLEDENDFNKYKDIIGIRTINYLIMHISKIRNLTYIEYSDISKLLRYDKRIKYNVYKYIGTIEDQIKQKLIDNTIFEGKFKNNKDKDNFSSLIEINKIDDNFYSINKILMELNKLKLISKNDKKTFEKIIDLRNKIMHFSLIYINYDWFKQKIYELGDLLPNFYRKGYIKTINDSKKKFELVHDLLMEDLK